jgi:hypothetical protein
VLLPTVKKAKYVGSSPLEIIQTMNANISDPRRKPDCGINHRRACSTRRHLPFDALYKIQHLATLPQ